MPPSWNLLLTSLPHPHLMQTWEWGQFKRRTGWTPYPLVWEAPGGEPRLRGFAPTSGDFRAPLGAAALLLVREIPLRGFAARVSVAYVPKGPVLDWQNAPLRAAVLRDLAAFARKKGAIFLKIDPDLPLGTGIPGEPEASEDPTGQAVTAELRRRGWQFSGEQIQFRNTVLVDLTPSEAELLARMKQKTRYNLRLAARKGVGVRPGAPADLGLLFQMYAETSVRDGFVIRDSAYYHDLWGTFMRAGMAEPLIAEVEGEPVAGVVVFRFGGRAWYLNGMSREAHRNLMPSYLLQWEAMRRAKAAGCTTYDLWGAPDIFAETDPLWGVFRFKQGLGGTVVRHIGAWDLPLRPLLFKLYAGLLPRALAFMRRRGKAHTRQLAGDGMR